MSATPLPSSRLNRDKLHMVPRQVGATMAHTALFTIQDEEPELIVAGTAMLFAALAQRTGIDPEELYRQGIRMLRPEPGDTRTNEQLEALRDFAGLRVMGENVTIG